MSIVSVDNIQPIGSGTSVTVNSAATLVTNNINSSGVVTATSFTGDGSGLTGVTATATGDKIEEGNTKAEVVDTGSDGHFKVYTEGTERIRIAADGAIKVPDGSSSTGRLSIGTGDDFKIYHESGNTTLENQTGYLKVQSDSIIYLDGNSIHLRDENGVTRYLVATNGALGIAGANYGTTGQIIRSNGMNPPEWSGYPRVVGLSTAAGQGGFSYITIPAYATKITVAFSEMSLNGSNNIYAQLGTSSGYITSGYFSQSSNAEGSKQTVTTGFDFYVTGVNHSYSGAMTIYKVNDTRYSYTYTATNGVSAVRVGGGTLTGISGTIDRLQLVTSGTNTFDSGVITIYAE